MLPHDWSQDCLELLSCSCGALLVLAFLGIITSLAGASGLQMLELRCWVPKNGTHDCMDGFLSAMALLAQDNAQVMMIFNEVMPFICPSHHALT